MALEFIVPSALPEATTVPDGAAIPMDTGLGEVQKATPAQIVATGRPLATEAQARAGTNSTTAITPLTLRQGVQSYLSADYGINEGTAAEIVAISEEFGDIAGAMAAIDADVAAAGDSAAAAAGSSGAAAGSAVAAEAAEAGAETAQALAEAARDAAETAAGAAEDAVQYDYLVADGTALAALTGMTTGQRAFVRATEHIWAYSGSAWVDMGLGPTAGKADQAAVDALNVQTAIQKALTYLSTEEFGPATFASTGDASGSWGTAVIWQPREFLPLGWVDKIDARVSSGSQTKMRLAIVQVVWISGSPIAMKVLHVIEKDVTGLAAGANVVLVAGVDFEPIEITLADCTLASENSTASRPVMATPETGYSVIRTYGAVITEGLESTSTAIATSYRLQMRAEVSQYLGAIAATEAVAGQLAPKAEAISTKPLFEGLQRFHQVLSNPGIIYPDGTPTRGMGTQKHTPYLPCWPGVTFTGDNMQSNLGSGGTGYRFAAFYGADFAPLTPAAGTYLVNAAGYGITNGLQVTAPAGTAYVMFSNYHRLNNFGQFGMRWDAVGAKWHSDVMRKYLDDDKTVSFHGDSIGTSFYDYLNVLADDAVLSLRLVNNAIGGESCLDSSWRAGTVPLVVKGPITLPANGSAVSVDAVWGWRASYAIDAGTGEYTLTGPTHSAMATGSYPAYFDYDGIRLELIRSGSNPAPTWTMRLVTAQADDLVIPGDLETTGTRTKGATGEAYLYGKPRGLGFVMMGTNGGFTSTENSYFTDPAGDPDRLLDLQQRMSDAFGGRSLHFSNWVGGMNGTGSVSGVKANQLAFEGLMEREFGSRFVNSRRYLMTQAIVDTQMVMTADEIARLNYGVPPLSLVPDATHSSHFATRWILDQGFRRAEQLGFIEQYVPLVTPVPAALALASSAGLSLSAGATTTLAITSPTPGLHVGAMTKPIVTSSNPSIVSVGTVPSNSSLAPEVTLTAVAAGSATITVQARFGGVTQAIDLTVT